MDTLVLNMAYQPIKYVNWEKAMTLWISGRVEVVEFHKNRVVHTVSEVISVPSIIRYTKGIFKSRIFGYAKYNKQSVFARDNGTCQYCGKVLSYNEFTRDHVIPVAQGGKTTWDNIVVSCKRCNNLKGNNTPKQAGMRLIKEPRFPSSYEIMKKKSAMKNQIIPEEWESYLSK
jgi:5-methylcytosine-specific restriction endonuclease McrA